MVAVRILSIVFSTTFFIGQANSMFLSFQERRTGLQEWGRQIKAKEEQKKVTKEIFSVWEQLFSKNALIPFFQAVHESHGMNPNEVVKYNGKTALMFACKHDTTGNLLNYLIGRGGFKLNAVNNKGQSAFSCALERKHKVCVKTLLDQPDLKISDEQRARADALINE